MCSATKWAKLKQNLNKNLKCINKLCILSSNKINVINKIILICLKIKLHHIFNQIGPSSPASMLFLPATRLLPVYSSQPRDCERKMYGNLTKLYCLPQTKNMLHVKCVKMCLVWKVLETFQTVETIELQR